MKNLVCSTIIVYPEDEHYRRFQILKILILEKCTYGTDPFIVNDDDDDDEPQKNDQKIDFSIFSIKSRKKLKKMFFSTFFVLFRLFSTFFNCFRSFFGRVEKSTFGHVRT